MYQLIRAIMDMDPLNFYLILGLSALWSYLIYEMTASWIHGVVSFPLFAGCSLLTVEVMESYRLLLAADETTNVIFGTCIGSILGICATFLAIQMMTRISSSRFEASKGKALREKHNGFDRGAGI